MAEYRGILLLGPTGSGKSPLGDCMEGAGLEGRRFCHFDFGANLRRVVFEPVTGDGFCNEEREFLRSVLESGALLEDDRFPLAERILVRFLETHSHGGQAEVVLNGLPRHEGQAEAVGRIVEVHTVVWLQCSPDAVLARIGTNVGGDRGQRTDDSREEVCRKLAIFAERTGPLVGYYRGLGRRVIELPVAADTTPEAAWRALHGELLS